MNTGTIKQEPADLSEVDFENEVERCHIPVFVDFHASWCQPCKALAPTFSSLADTYAGRVKFLKVDADLNTDLVKRLSVRGLPTLLLFQNGQVVERVVGGHHKAFFNDLLNKYVEKPVLSKDAVEASFRAFEGNSSVRDEVISRVGNLIASSQIYRGGAKQGGGSGYSFLEAAAGIHGVEERDDVLGIPMTVGRIQQAVHSLLLEQVGPAKDGVYRLNAPHDRKPIEWWESVPPGSDLSPMTSPFVSWFLLDLLGYIGETGGNVTSDIRSGVEAVARLHLHRVSDSEQGSKQWEAARAELASVRERPSDGPLLRSHLELASRLAWPVEALENAVVDAMHSRFHTEVEETLRGAYPPGQYAESLQLLEELQTRFKTAYDEKFKSRSRPPRVEIEAMEEFQSLQKLWQPHQHIREEEMDRARLVYGERMHAGLMRALSDTVAAT